MKRSPEATAEEILEWFFNNPEGVVAKTAYKIVPGRIIPAGMLMILIGEGKLICTREQCQNSTVLDGWDDPWEFRYRISYDEWVKRASRNKSGDG